MITRRRRTPLTLPVLLIGAVGFMAQRAARAMCAFPIQFGQLSAACSGSYCYVVSPGVGTYDSMTGSFWALGFGNPAAGSGDDNGTWLPSDGWLASYAGHYYINGNWAQSSKIDGCIDGQVPPGHDAPVMAAAFSDRSADGLRGYFAVAAVAENVAATPQLDFASGIGRDITLAPIPPPFVAASQQVGPHTIELQVQGPTTAQAAAGYYGDGSTSMDEAIAGYRVYTQPEPWGVLPQSRRPDSGWTPATGTVPLGATTTVDLDCTRMYAFLALSIVDDSGFEHTYLGSNSTSIKCEMCLGDADGDGYSPSTTCGAVDCDDADAATHPGALEVNDGLDNQCAGDPGYGIVDEVDGISGFEGAGDKTTYSWPAQALATSYEVARSSDPTFASGCTTFPTAGTSITDPDVPDPDGVFFYLVRSTSPHVGSWGRRSTGVERTTSCP